jgi:hypothetical protein
MSSQIPAKPAIAYPFRIHPLVYTHGFLRRRVKSRVFKAEAIFYCNSGSQADNRRSSKKAKSKRQKEKTVKSV